MKVYRKLTPSGVIADGAWLTEEEIPETLRDRSYARFFAEDTDTIEVEMTEDEFEHARQL